jgi:hypothetical protein
MTHDGATPRTAQALAALALCLPMFCAQAALATLIRSFVDKAANDRAELVCVYRDQGREFERRYLIGSFCPAYEEV